MLFMDRFLLSSLRCGQEKKESRYLVHREVSCGNQCNSRGQTLVAFRSSAIGRLLLRRHGRTNLLGQSGTKQKDESILTRREIT